jgi:hypothetical protein
MGDGWLWATSVARSELLVNEEKNGERAAIDTTELALNWIWEVAPEEDDPLNEEAPHWQAPKTAMLFDVGGAGPGAPPAYHLLQAGVVALGHVCKRTPEGTRWMAFEEATSRCTELSRCQEARRQWEATIEWLESRGVAPVEPERAVGAREWWRGQGPAARQAPKTALLRELPYRTHATPWTTEGVDADGDDPTTGSTTEAGDAALGAPPAHHLLQAGVVALGHMCETAPGGARWMTFEEAKARCTELSHCQEARRQWDETIEWLEWHGVEPEAPERAVGARAQWRAGAIKDGRPVDSVDHEAVRRLLPEVLQATVNDVRTTDEWAERIRACFRVAVKPAESWDTGMPTAADTYEGACVWYDRTQEGRSSARRSGGQAGWLRRPETEVDQDGFAHKWYDKLIECEQKWSIDAEGYVVDTATQTRVDVAQSAELPVAVQMAARAREALTGAVEVVDEPEWLQNEHGKWRTNKLKNEAGDEEHGEGPKARKINLAAARSTFSGLLP